MESEENDGTADVPSRSGQRRQSRRTSAGSSNADSAGQGGGGAASLFHLRTMQAKARKRADMAMHAYTGALGELREEMQVSHFEAWTLEQLQEFLVDNNVEVRGSTMLSRASFVALLEKMFKGCTEPPNAPAPLSEEFKKKRENSVRMVQDVWFWKKRAKWTNVMATPSSDGHLQANPLHSPRGVMAAAVRGRVSEDTPWTAPSVEEARSFEGTIHPRRPEGGKFDTVDSKTGRYCFLGGCGEQLDLWDEGKISHFAPYGAGVTSYFKFLKFCSWAFLVVSAAVVPHLFINSNGDAISVTTNTDKMSWTTVGNLGSTANSTTVVLPFCDETQYSTCIMDKKTLGFYYGFIDACMVMLLLAGYFWVNSFIKDEFEGIKRNTVTAADFTVMVRNLPPDTTEAELAGHFSAVLGRVVVEVAIARDNRNCINLYAQSGKLYHERAATRDLIRYLKTKAESVQERAEEGGQGSTPEGGRFERFFRNLKIRKLQKQRVKASRQILRLAAEAKMAARLQNRAVAAFVTFEEEMGVVDARVKYSGSLLRRLFMPKAMRLRGRRIAVQEAPEPSTILWENFGYGRCELLARRSLTFVVAASFLCLSVTMSILALYQNQLAEDEGGTAECPSDWDSLSDQEQLDAIAEDDSILHCLCAEADDSIFSLDSDDVCFEYITAKFEALWLVFATSFMVAFTNAGINKITRMMGAFEKHKSMDSQEVSIFRRLVLLKFMNIGLTVLITNSRRVIQVTGVNLDYEEDFTPAWYRTLGSSLVMNVVLNAVTPHLYWLFLWAKRNWAWKTAREKAISQDALNKLIKGARWEVDRQMGTLAVAMLGVSVALSAFMMSFIEVSVRYAEISVIFAVCAAYSAGIPILLPVGAVSFLLFYWVEKALFVNFYLTPPQYSGKLTSEVVSLIPYSLWIHVVFAFYMYGNGSVFPVDATEDETGQVVDTFDFASKLEVQAVQPLLVPLFLLSFFIVQRWLGSTIISFAGRLVSLLTCKGKITSTKLEKMCNTVTVDYSRAVVRGILRGLTSYNILLNPKYKESFCLSDSFACQHKRVGSIFGMLEEHPSIMDLRKTMREARQAEKDKKTGKHKNRDENGFSSRKAGGLSPRSPLDATNSTSHLQIQNWSRSEAETPRMGGGPGEDEETPSPGTRFSFRGVQ